jgi:hypothetical protein
MNNEPNDYKDKRRSVYYIFVGAVFIFFTLILNGLFFGAKDNVHSQEPFRKFSAKIEDRTKTGHGVWDGPILFYKGNGKPVHLILVEKAIQKLHLYRYDGQYQLIKSYTCSTGENQGKKHEEKDRKTPEGIYFNIKAYRDSKITLFGDRAFRLNYPDPFDHLESNRGNGIFIHGSNRAIKPFSTNGCVVLSNHDLSDLDQRINLKKIPVIIGERLPYRFEPAGNNLSQFIPLFKKAMIPENYASMKSEFRYIALLGFQERIVALSAIRIKDAGDILGFSKLFLVRPDKNFLVLLKREWNEEKLVKKSG